MRNESGGKEDEWRYQGGVRVVEARKGGGREETKTEKERQVSQGSRGMEEAEHRRKRGK